MIAKESIRASRRYLDVGGGGKNERKREREGKKKSDALYKMTKRALLSAPGNEGKEKWLSRSAGMSE